MSSQDTVKFVVKTTAKLEKYAPGVPEEDIKAGKVKPIEVIDTETETELTDENLKQLKKWGFDTREAEQKLKELKEKKKEKK